MGKCFLNYECECLHLLSSNPVLLISVYFQSPRMILGCLEIFIPERQSLKLLHCIQLFTFPQCDRINTYTNGSHFPPLSRRQGKNREKLNRAAHI